MGLGQRLLWLPGTSKARAAGGQRGNADGAENQGMSKRQSKDAVGRDRDVTLDTGRTRPKSPQEALEPARAPGRPLEIEAQAHLQFFYEGFGFARTPRVEFLDGGIPHVEMSLTLPDIA